MSTISPQDRTRAGKREYIQRGRQWIKTRLDRFRGGSASACSTRPSNAQAAGVPPSGAIPSLGNAACGLDAPVPPNDLLVSSNSLRMATCTASIHSLAYADAGISRSNSNQAPVATPFVTSERGVGIEHTTSSRQPSYNRARDEPTETPLPCSRPLPEPRRTFDQEPVRDVSYGPVYNIRTTGNVFAGMNYGPLNMTSGTEDFILKLRAWLKVSIKADHLYYAGSDESALRRTHCTPGTRINILRGVMCWAMNMVPSSERVYWLSGQAGAGKTTIAYTVARQFETLLSEGNGEVVLGGSFFCSRQFPDTRSATSIIRTIVYQLAWRSDAFRAALREHGMFETVDHGPRSQLRGLLVVPWKHSAPERLAKNEPCYVIPIDALDELEGTGGADFLGTLFDVVNQQDLSGLKFFITSRSDPALVNRITSFPNRQICRLEEVPLKESSADIKLYLNETLGECATPQQIEQLVTDAAGLFIYAATVVEYVKARNVGEQKSLLHRLLPASSSSSRCGPPPAATTTLDNLYLQILETSLVDPRDQNNPEVFRDCLSILHTFLCTIERTSASVAIDIFNASRGNSDTELDAGMAQGVIHRLHAVLYIQGGQVMWFHKSFTDFLFDERRSHRFFCDQQQHHHRLANGCLAIMTEQLRFNIADIQSSYQMDRDSLTLANRINTNISAPLRYACRNWSAHLIQSPLKVLDDLMETLRKFLHLRVLFWMEAMNLLGQRGYCPGMLREAQRWFSKSKDTAELVSKLVDAAAFAAYHSTSKAALSTPHLYLSSLATFPRCSTIIQNWRRQIGGIPGFVSAHRVSGDALVACITLKNAVTALAISPDGVNVAVGSREGLVQIWDLSTGEDVRALEGHTGTVWGVAYSPDGTHAVSGSDDGSVRIWDLTTGEGVSILKGHTSEVNSVAYLRNGARVVSGSSDKSIRVWDVSTGEEVGVLQGHTDSVWAVASSPDGTRAVSGSSDNSVRVWDLSAGAEVRILHGHTDRVNSVAFSPHGTHVVSGSSDRSVRVWDLSTGEEGRIFTGHNHWIRAVAYSPDGTHVVSGASDHSVRVWDVSTGDQVGVLKGHSRWVRAVAYLPDVNHVVTGSEDQTVRVWDVPTPERWTGVLKEHASQTSAAAYLPDGANFVSNQSKQSARAWDLLTGVRVPRGHTRWVRAVAYSPDGTHVVSGSEDKSLRVWDVSTGEEVMVLKGHAHWVRAAAFSLDGTHVVTGSEDKTLRVWNASTGEEVKVLKGHAKGVWAVAYSPDGTHVVSGSFDHSVRIWNVATGKERMVLEGHTDSIRAVAYSPEGSFVLSGSEDQTLRVWNVSTGENVRILKGHTDTVRTVAYSPDIAHVISGSKDRTLRVWDVSTGEEVMVLQGHTGGVQAVAYSPDGIHVVSGSSDKSVRVWDVSTGEEVKVLKGHTNRVRAVAYSPDGALVLSGSFDKSVRVWDISPEYTPRYVRQQGPDGEYTGWLLSPTDPSYYLMFARPGSSLADDSNVLTFPASAVSHIDFSNAKFGDKWVECCILRSL